MSNDTFAARVDAITVEELRTIGGTKWADPTLLGAFVAEMDFGIDPLITRALSDAVAEGAFGYTPPKYSLALKAATAQRLQDKFGMRTTPEHVFPVPDVIKALEVAIEHFSAPGSKIIVPTPAYMPFLKVPAMLGREIIEVPMRFTAGAWRFDLDAIQRAFDDGGNCFVLCNPYNPLGRVFDRSELLALCEVVERNRGRVFSDEIWAPLVYPGAELVPYASVSEAAANHTLTATSASKAWNLPGLKCAQLIVSNEADREVLTEIAQWVGHGTATPGIIANTVAFERGDAWLGEALSYLQGNRDELVSLVAELLPGVRMTMPEASYIAWLDFRDIGIAHPGEFFRERAGVALTDGADCGTAGRGCARLIFAMPRPILRETVQSMSAALAPREEGAKLA